VQGVEGVDLVVAAAVLMDDYFDSIGMQMELCKKIRKKVAEPDERTIASFDADPVSAHDLDLDMEV